MNKCKFCNSKLRIDTWVFPADQKEYMYYVCEKCGSRYSVREIDNVNKSV